MATNFRRVTVLAAAVSLLSVPAFAQRHEAGDIGPGSHYEIDVPAVWNGDLVLYAHGIVQADLPVVPPTSQDGYAAIRAQLLARGYAVAASSYSSNGWALADAVRRTHQLSGLFSAMIGRPNRTFLMGHSMGALAIVKMAEKYPGQYVGALSMCGPLGGALDEVQYAGSARVTFDHFFPGLLPGDAFDVPPGIPYEPGSPLFNQVYATLVLSPAGQLRTAQWASAAGLPYASTGELFNSALYVVGFLWRYTNDLIERVNGKMPFDNHPLDYVVDVPGRPAAENQAATLQLNAGVERYDADRAAVNFYDHNYQPDGRIGVPVLTLHTLRDPAIPYWHEQKFAGIVAGAGRSALLSQRAINRWGHCAITPDETIAAFADLETWVSTGQRPQ